MAKSNLSSKSSKLGATGRIWIAPFALLRQESFKERTQPCAEWKLSDLAALLAFGFEPNNSSFKRNIAKWKSSFAKSASLPVSDSVSSKHPVGSRPESPLTPEQQDYLTVLSERNWRLLAGNLTFDPKLVAWIISGKPTLHGLLHYYPQELDLKYCGVPATKSASPGYIATDKLTSKLTRDEHAELVKKLEDVSPGLPASDPGKPGFTVSLVNKPPNPSMPHFWSTRSSLAFLPCEFFPEPSSFLRFRCKVMTKLCRFLDSLARFVSKLRPPVGGVDPAIKASHNVGQCRPKNKQKASSPSKCKQK